MKSVLISGHNYSRVPLSLLLKIVWFRLIIGLQYVRQLVTPEYNSVELEIANKSVYNYHDVVKL